MGQAAAREIARRGHTVVATMRNPADFAAFGDAEGTFDLERMDVDDPASVTAALGSVEARHGRIDVLVNNAGFGVWGAVEDLSVEALQKQFETNTFGTLRTCQAVLPGMRARGRGRILNLITNVNAPVPWMAAYFASKAAVWQLSASLACEVKPAGVQIAVVQPGGYKTDWQHESLLVADGEEVSPISKQARDSLEAFRAFTKDWPGPDDFGRRLADLIDEPSIPFWNLIAHESQADRLRLAGTLTFEQQAAMLREVIPNFVP
jgi:NAD(P)-dependent dehydrogenase (short-subunit alcohol dehydrogenase family)